VPCVLLVGRKIVAMFSSLSPFSIIDGLEGCVFRDAFACLDEMLDSLSLFIEYEGDLNGRGTSRLCLIS